MKISSPCGTTVRGLGRFLLTLVVVAAILLTTGFFAVRTRGGRSFIEDWLEKRTGMDMNIPGSRIGWPYELVLERPMSAGFRSGAAPGVKAQEVRIGLGLRTGWRVSVQGCVVSLMRGKDRSWEPQFLSVLGDLPLKNIAEISRITSGFRQSTSLRVGDSSIRWLDSEGMVKISASGVDFAVTPLRMPRRIMYHHHISICSMRGLIGTHMTDIERVWLASDERDYVEIHGAEREMPDSAKAFWEATQ